MEISWNLNVDLLEINEKPLREVGLLLGVHIIIF